MPEIEFTSILCPQTDLCKLASAAAYRPQTLVAELGK